MSSWSLRVDVSGEDSHYFSSRRSEVRGAAVAEPRNQAPDVSVNGVAPRLPLVKLPSAIQGETTLGCLLEQQKILPEVGSGTNQLPATEVVHNDPAGTKTRRTGQRTKRDQELPTEHRCEECGSYFNCRKDLRRHRATTKVHGAPAVALCSCGTTVRRKDARRVHRRRCRGTWVWGGE